MIYESQDWLIKQAKEYEIALHFDNLQFGQDNDIVFSHIPDGTEEDYDAWVVDLCRELDYSSTDEFLETLYEEGEYDNINILIIANAFGTSYALPFGKGYDSDDYIEAAVIYREDEVDKICSATIAHEMLHLYGACDLYETEDEGSSREKKVRKKYPDEIMLEIYYNIYDNTICEITAYYIGWHDEHDDWYEELIPPGYYE